MVSWITEQDLTLTQVERSGLAGVVRTTALLLLTKELSTVAELEYKLL